MPNLDFYFMVFIPMESKFLQAIPPAKQAKQYFKYIQYHHPNSSEPRHKHALKEEPKWQKQKPQHFSAKNAATSLQSGQASVPPVKNGTPW
jgi:hypothetical protein